MKTKGLALFIRLIIVLLNTVNLALALALALQKQKMLVPVIRTVEEKDRTKVLVAGGDDGPTAVWIRDTAKPHENQAEKS